MSMKRSDMGRIKTLLKARQREVGKVRDKLRKDISDFEDLADTCERAFDDIESALQALSELA